MCRKEECAAGTRDISTACVFFTREELHKGDVWLPWHRPFHHPVHHPEKWSNRPQQQQLLHRPWSGWTGGPAVAWSWVRMALLCAMGFQTFAEFCQGTEQRCFYLLWILTDWLSSKPSCTVFFLPQTQYGNPMIYVTENGVSEKMMCTELCDEWRIQYYKDYINEMLKGEWF